MLDKPLPSLSSNAFVNDPVLLVALFRDRSRRFAMKLGAAFSKMEAEGSTFDEATNGCAIQSYKAAQCHSSYVMAFNNLEAIDNNCKVDHPAIYTVMLDLLHLQLLMQMREELADWICVLPRPFEGGEDVADAILQKINRVLAKIRPDAVGLADSFGYDDHQLQSTLGRYDGNVYEAIYDEAKKCPLNATPKMVGWEKLAPIFDLDFLQNGVKQRHLPSVGTTSKL
jgi:acyl-CoA oxidase